MLRNQVLSLFWHCFTLMHCFMWSGSRLKHFGLRNRNNLQKIVILTLIHVQQLSCYDKVCQFVCFRFVHKTFLAPYTHILKEGFLIVNKKEKKNLFLDIRENILIKWFWVIYNGLVINFVKLLEIKDILFILCSMEIYCICFLPLYVSPTPPSVHGSFWWLDLIQ